YAAWANPAGENLCLVEDGRAVLRFGEREEIVKKGDAFKTQPGQIPQVIPEAKLRLISIQMPVVAEVEGENRGDRSRLQIARPELIPSRVYEYETLGQECITCQYPNGLGLLRFVFPRDRIPLHRHPYAGRLIRTISGRGYVYV